MLSQTNRVLRETGKWEIFHVGQTTLGQTRKYWDRPNIFGTDRKILGQTRKYWDRPNIFGTGRWPSCPKMTNPMCGTVNSAIQWDSILILSVISFPENSVCPKPIGLGQPEILGQTFFCPKVGMSVPSVCLYWGNLPPNLRNTSKYVFYRSSCSLRFTMWNFLQNDKTVGLGQPHSPWLVNKLASGHVNPPTAVHHCTRLGLLLSTSTCARYLCVSRFLHGSWYLCRYWHSHFSADLWMNVALVRADLFYHSAWTFSATIKFNI